MPYYEIDDEVEDWWSDLGLGDGGNSAFDLPWGDDNDTLGLYDWDWGNTDQAWIDGPDNPLNQELPETIYPDPPGRIYNSGRNPNISPIYIPGGGYPSGGGQVGSSGGAGVAGAIGAIGGAIAGGNNNQDNMAQGNTLWDWGKKILPSVLDIYSGYSAKKTSENAAEIEALARAEANQLIKDQWEDTKGALKPYSEGGHRPFEMQQELVGAKGVDAQEQAFQNYRESPGVAWAREQGLKGVNQQASATGNLGGGNRLKRLTEYSQGMALQDFNNYFNRLGSATGVGLAASQAMAGVGGQAAMGQAANVVGAGESRAAGQIAGQNSFNSGLGNAWNRIAPGA